MGGKLQSNGEKLAKAKTGKPSILQHSKELLPSLSGKNGIPAKSALLEPGPKPKATAERKRKALYTKEQEAKATAERMRKASSTKEQEDVQATTNTKTAEAALDPNIQWICTKIICQKKPALGFEAQHCPSCKMPRTIVGADVSASRPKRGSTKETSKQPEEDAAKVKRASCQKSCPDCMKLSWPATRACTCGHIFKKKAKLL